MPHRGTKPLPNSYHNSSKQLNAHLLAFFGMGITFESGDLASSPPLNTAKYIRVCCGLLQTHKDTGVWVRPYIVKGWLY